MTQNAKVTQKQLLAVSEKLAKSELRVATLESDLYDKVTITDRLREDVSELSEELHISKSHAKGLEANHRCHLAELATAYKASLVKVMTGIGD